MAVAHDASSESHTGTTGSASEASFSWSHTVVGTPKGVFVLVFTIGTDNLATSVTYGGVTMLALGTDGGVARDTATEPGVVKLFYLGSGVPTGNQTVVVNRTNNAT